MTWRYDETDAPDSHDENGPLSLDHAIRQIPPGWFLYGLGECVTPIIYAKDRHDPKGSFWAELQHRDGGRLTRAEGPTMEAAVSNAISVLRPITT